MEYHEATNLCPSLGFVTAVCDCGISLSHSLTFLCHGSCVCAEWLPYRFPALASNGVSNTIVKIYT